MPGCQANQSSSPLRVGELRGRQRVGERAHGVDLHLQRRHVVDRLLEQLRRGELPASRDEAAQHAEPLLHLAALLRIARRPCKRGRFALGMLRPAVAPPDLAARLHQHAAAAAGGAGQQDCAAPARLAARRERQRRVGRGLDGARLAAARGAERVQQAAPVDLVLRAAAPLAGLRRRRRLIATGAACSRGRRGRRRRRRGGDHSRARARPPPYPVIPVPSRTAETQKGIGGVGEREEDGGGRKKKGKRDYWVGVGALRWSCRLLLFALLLLLIRVVVVVVGFALLGCCFSLFTTQHNTALVLLCFLLPSSLQFHSLVATRSGNAPANHAHVLACKLRRVHHVS
ncbi:hypothetical protein GQ55_9G112000 [Panicum hallii var. hallii]|uniref:Uncharacterized protein n=1 Tax=Panicum hallii var. hallii TaxID=1504633 RepID=A0A2T7C207_9POAL|nr:hypothetical protein GQ55_9G112000 [Panicum hallii var. hallii]